MFGLEICEGIRLTTTKWIYEHFDKFNWDLKYQIQGVSECGSVGVGNFKVGRLRFSKIVIL